MNTIIKMNLRPASMPPRQRPRARINPGLDRLTPEGLRLEDALRLRSAEFWIMLGMSDRASRELEALSSAVARHPWALRIQWAVVSALTFA